MGSLMSSCYAKLDTQSYGMSLFERGQSPDVVAVSTDGNWKVVGMFDRANSSLYLKFISMRPSDFSYTEDHKEASVMKQYGPQSLFIQSINAVEKRFIPAKVFSPVTGEFEELPNDHFGMWYFKFDKARPMPNGELVAQRFINNNGSVM